jgi:abortive infection bacteriophage resistance protein
MNANQNFLTVEEQIVHLKKKGIDLGPSDVFATKVLSETSYYAIVNGYSEPFRFKPNPKEYLRGVTFKEIYSLYFFDKRLRTFLLPFLLEAESRLKNDIVYAFLSQRNSNGSLKVKNDDYLKSSSYDSSNLQNALTCIANFQKIISECFSKSDAIQHYLVTYGFVPLWVLETRMTFGDLNRFYSALPIQVRQAVSIKYELPDDDLATLLHVLTFSRNACAHRDRVYCLRHKFMLPRFDSSKHPEIASFTSKGQGDKTLFSAMLALFAILGKKDVKPLLNSIKHEMGDLEKKLTTVSIDDISSIMGFPNNWYSSLTAS